MFKVQTTQLSFDQHWLCQSCPDYTPYGVYCDYGRRTPHDRRPRESDCSLDLRPVVPVSVIHIEEISNSSSGGSQISSQNEIQIEKQEEEQEGIQGEELQNEENSFERNAFVQELNKRWKGVIQFDLSQKFAIEVIDFKRMTNQLMKEFLVDLTSTLNNNSILNFDNLSLNFAKCFNINDKGIKYLASHIAAHLTTLRALSLNFEKCQNITNQSVEELSVTIGSSLKNLQHLSLSFYDCPKVTDQGVSKLASQIAANLQSLQKLELDFRLCWKITDAGIKDLTKISTSLRNLQTLSLLFKLCNITDEGVEVMAHEVQANLKKLQYLSLNFIMCDKISQEARDLLAGSLSFVNSLNIEY